MIPIAAKIGMACVGALCAAAGNRRSSTGGVGRGHQRCKGRAQLKAETRRRRRRGKRDIAPPTAMQPTSVQPTAPQGQSTPPMPWLPDDVTSSLNDALQSGVSSAPTMTTHALQTVYPTGVDGQSMKWPTCTGDCAEKQALESRVAIRAERLLAEARDVEADAMWTAGGGY